MGRKFCVTASIANCHPKALVMFRGLEEGMRRASELGYDGVELALYDRSNVDAADLKRLLAAYGLGLPVISTGQMLTMSGLSFTHADSAVRALAVERFNGIIELAAEFGADVNVSRVRGSAGDSDSLEAVVGRLTQSLGAVCRHAEKYGLSVLLEQMNRYETNLLNSAEEVGEYIRSLRISNLRIHADVFHMNIEDRSMTEPLRKYREELGYVHFADSNRLAPGMGHLNFREILRTLEEIGYPGWIGVEALPLPDAAEAARQSICHLKKYLRREAERMQKCDADSDLMYFMDHALVGLAGLKQMFCTDGYYDDAVEMILEAGRNGNRLHVSGIGKPHHIGGYYASLLSSIGFPAYFLDGTEAVHGSSGQVLPGDVVICISYYGNVEELIRTIKTLKRNGAKILSVTGMPQSWIALNSDVHLNAPVPAEGDYLGKPPRLSMLAAMLCLQGLSVILQRRRGLTAEEYVKWHPGGELGKK